MRRTVRGVASLAATALVIVAGIIGVQSAQAATQGPGFGTWPGSGIGWEGAFVAPDGSYIYCIVPGASNPTGATTSAGIQTSISSNSPFGSTVISGDAAAKINTLVSEYGQRADNVNASAISFAVKHLGNPVAMYGSSGWNGSHDLDGFIHYKLVGLVGSSTVQAIQARTHSLLDAVAGVTAGAVQGAGRLVFTIDADNDQRGTVTMSGTHASGTVSLVNGGFLSTGTASIAGMQQGIAYPIYGAPPAGDGRPFRISGSGVFGVGYSPALHVWTTPGQQTAVGPGGSGTFTVSGQDTRDRSVSFAPYIQTRVEQKYTPGGRFVDIVSFGTTLNQWPRFNNGTSAVVSATATVYKTPTQPAVPTSEIPDDAVAVGDLQLTTDPVIGRTQPYRVESDWELPGPGVYTAIWTIDGADQNEQTRAYLVDGADYHRREMFGELSQMTFVPNITSEAQKVAALGADAVDTVIAADILPIGGADISTVLHRVPDGMPPADVCTDDTVVWRSDVRHIDALGRYTFTAPSLPAFGEYAWQHRATDADGASIMVSECGIESEMTRVPVPTIDSRAPESIGFGGVVRDIAIVDGLVPATGETYVTFALYRAPEGVSPIGSCTVDTLVGDTTGRPVIVTGAGEYTSPGIRTTQAGVHYSVESLWWRDGEGGEPILLDAGECGLAHETTVASDVGLRTNAVPQVDVGGPYWDEAIVEGLADDVRATIVFDVFHNVDGQAPTCTAGTRVETSRVPITGSGTFRSPTLTATTAGRQLWVATVEHLPEGATEPVVLARGECGDADEVTLVAPVLPALSILPLTGGMAAAPAVLVGAAIALLSGSAVLFVMAIRRRSSTGA